MSDQIVVEAVTRKLEGKGASRRLRRLESLMPAVVYGGDKEPASISIVHKEMMKFVNKESFFTSILSLEIDGVAEQVVLQDLQRHAAKPLILHADFLRVNDNTVIKQRIPLHFINEEACKGVKEQGGKITHQMVEVEVVCAAKDLPEYIEVDMIGFEKGAIVHISDLVFPAGVKSVQLEVSHDLPIASV